MRDPEWTKEFGRRVRAARIEVELTQEELARQVPISRSSIAAIETGKHDLPLHVAVALAKALGVRLERLVPPLGRSKR